MSGYLVNTAADQAAMLQRIGVSSIEELFSPIPRELRLTRPLQLPQGMTEQELTDHIQTLARQNQSAVERISFLGGGAYDHFIPSVVDVVASRSEFYTAYTPYQAEASQGTLQAIYEYQTLICQLTGMDVANASLYDGASAAAEAMLMALAITGRSGEVLLAESVHPEYRQVVATYAANLKCRVVTLPTPAGFLDPAELTRRVNEQTVCVIVQSPNFFGHLEEVADLAKVTKAVGALLIQSFDPISLGILPRPADYGADIAVAEGQGLGIPLGYGGPYLGILACRGEYVRKIPGRLVGQTTDRHGQRCWTLTLQPREQHIARARATSNICTNQGLYALRAAVYLAALGPRGLRETAERCLKLAHFAARRLCELPGVRLRFPDRPFFKEFTLELPMAAEAVLPPLRQAGYEPGLPLSRWYPQWSTAMSVAVTERRTRGQIEGLAESLRHYLESIPSRS
jgi:glycine dehydrogenase subunit 1